MDKLIKNTPKKLFKSYTHNKHIWMHLSCSVSILFLSLSFIILLKPQGYFFEKISSEVLKNIIINIIAILSKTGESGIQLFFTIIPAIGSGIMVLLNGKKLIIILQIKTLFKYVIIKITSILSLISIFLGIYALSIKRITCSTLAFLSFSVFFIYILFYLIRYYNDKSYYRSEICACLIKLYDKSKTPFFSWLDSKLNRCSSFENYITRYIWPDVPTDHNNVQNDISIVKYLIHNMKFELSDENNLQRFFCEVLAPIVAQLRQTYSEDNEEFLLDFLTQISKLRSENSNYDFLLHHFVNILCYEYLIETMHLKHLNKNKLTEWIKNNNNIYLSLYDFPTEMPLEDFKPNFHSILNSMYVWYICELDNRSVININTYSLNEKKYMEYNEIIEFMPEENFFKHQYDYFDILHTTYKRKAIERN